MHRLIVTSATYRQSSRVTAEHRGPRRRQPPVRTREPVPDAVAHPARLGTRCRPGCSNSRIGGRPVYPYQPDAVWEALAITKERDFTYPTSSGSDLYRRSLYTFWRRTVGPANMFDASNRQTCRVRSITTSTPLHALTTLNDPTWVEAARVLAQESMKATSRSRCRLTYAFRAYCAATPTEHDLKILRHAYDTQAAIYRADVDSARALLKVGAARRDESLNSTEHAALSAVCLAILNLDEALSRE